MKPIIGLAIVAIAAIGLGTGFLSNDIDLWIQQFGVGSGDITTPTDHALVDFDITQTQDQFGNFKNRVEHCEITLDDQVGQPLGPVTEGDVTFEVTKQSELTCKITDRDGNIIAEGTLVQDFFLPAPAVHSVQVLKDPADGTSFPKVTEVHDVIVVAHANTYSMGDAEPSSP